MANDNGRACQHAYIETFFTMKKKGGQNESI